MALFNLLHVFPAIEEVDAQTAGELAGQNEEQAVNCFRQRAGAAGGNERNPLKHESGVPKNEESEHRRNCREAGRRERNISAARSRKTLRPTMKSGVREMKKRLPKEEMPAQSG